MAADADSHGQEGLRKAGVSVFERGWLSANNILLEGGPPGTTTLVDTGYVSHSEQTVQLVQNSLGPARKLDLILNTHLHSDHCGGNAALKVAYPNARTLIPPGHSDAVMAWDEDVLTFRDTGQDCARFNFDALLIPGTSIHLGRRLWQIHAAKGHDPHSIVLFEPESRILISADALWENGFGVVFPELEGIHAFEEVAATLDLIEQLDPTLILPGHGKWFSDLSGALHRARTRLEGFLLHPEKHRRHAVKVLIKYRLLDWQQIPFEDLLAWTKATPFLAAHLPDDASDDQEQWLAQIVLELERAKAARRDGDWVINT